MRHGPIYVVGLLVLGILMLPARVTEAQTTAVGPYYATPSWDQTMACTAPANCPRFVVLSNFNSEAVLDRETGLVWERSPDAQLFFWISAVFHCSMTKVGNRMGWRLPTVAELTSLIDPATSVPPAGHPFVNVQQLDYWSGTSNMRNFDFGFTFELYGLNRLLNRQRDQAMAYVWCVRGGQGADGQ
jgi:Protein of unknown function (DUF1566)